MESLLILFVMLILSGFFSGSETAMTSITMARVESLVQQNKRGSASLLRLKSNTDRMLIAILIGNNLVNIGASAMATVLATEHFGELGPGLAVGALTLFILIFGEITPKTFAARYAAPMALIAAPVMELFANIVFPLVWILEQLTGWLQSLSSAKADPTVTESELISLARHGAQEGSIEADEERMIQSVFALDTLRAADIMIPRNLMFSMNGHTPLQDALPQLLKQPHSRVPLHGGDQEEITKVVYLREILEELAQGNMEKPLFDCGHDPIFVPLNQPVDYLLDRLREDKRRLILVVDAAGVLQGLFTIEDILEELVGEIRDKQERDTDEISSTEGGGLQLLGSVELRVVEDHFDKNLPGKPTDSVNQWIIDRTARIPKVDECFELDGLSVCVTQATPRTIREVRIEHL
ncbi:MAG: HlyC/CorC family transporter [Magnetococcales bacterium]|nr:HlyC/CorC family transporter [Magnetococcales bacterium]